MAVSGQFPNCCAVATLSGFQPYWSSDTPVITGGYTKSFIAIFTEHQKQSYQNVCAKHKLLSVTKVPSGHGGNGLAICVFKKGK